TALFRSRGRCAVGVRRLEREQVLGELVGRVASGRRPAHADVERLAGSCGEARVDEYPALLGCGEAEGVLDGLGEGAVGEGGDEEEGEGGARYGGYGGHISSLHIFRDLTPTKVPAPDINQRDLRALSQGSDRGKSKD